MVVTTGAFVPLVAACQLLFPTVAEPVDADGGDSGGARDGRSDGAHDDDDGAPGPYNDPDSSNWQVYSLGLGSPYYVGGAYDGRHVYLSPGGGAVARYDTHAPFATGWSTFDPAKLSDGGSDTFRGATFDGQFVYFIGFHYDGEGNSAVFARFDTRARFGEASSWKEFDLTAADPRAIDYAGGAFDGRFMYFAPTANGHVARFDTRGSFQDAASWAGSDVAAANAPAFEGAIFDGHYVYFIPHDHSLLTDAGRVQGTRSGVAARLDPRAFGSPGAWTMFDTAKVDVNAIGFASAVFDGRYIYLVPYGAPIAVALRYDTRKTAFDSESSWEKFDCALALPGATGFVGGAFDGRYVYFAPDIDSAGYPASTLLRYDTSREFRDPGSWISYDIAQQNTNARSFAGAVFDGEYVYFVPIGSGVVAQFHARTTPLPQDLPIRPASFF